MEGGEDLRSMLNALGQLWQHGIDPDWTQLYSGERRRILSLPTYPFERKRYWIDAPTNCDEPQPEAVAQSTPEVEVQSVDSQVPVEPVESIESNSRRPQLVSKLIDLFQDLSGAVIAEADVDASFLELGFDSLFLTQASRALQAKFGLEITFRMLLVDLSSITAVAAFLDRELPRETVRNAASATRSTANSDRASTTLMQTQPAYVPTMPLDAPLAERLVRTQLEAMAELMRQQLAAFASHEPAVMESVVQAQAAFAANRSSAANQERQHPTRCCTGFNCSEGNIAAGGVPTLRPL